MSNTARAHCAAATAARCSQPPRPGPAGMVPPKFTHYTKCELSTSSTLDSRPCFDLERKYMTKKRT